MSGLAAQCPNLVWSDEFDGASLDETNWNYQTEDGCNIGICDWGNSEAQWYQRENLSVEDGMLKIVARRESVGGKAYTSARITTKDKQDLTYGYLEARMKLPPGRGLWPAFWMLSTDEPYGFWPQSGEIDIMEWVGREPQRLFGTIHYGQPVPNNSSNGDGLELRQGAWSDDFHTYAVHWTENRIDWFVDGYRYGTQSNNSIGNNNWPFDHDFHFLLNLAVGGTFGGTIASDIFPATMEVDYVRVYDARPPVLEGIRSVESEQEGVLYLLRNLPAGATVEWSVPTGATLTESGDVTQSIRVDFGTESGLVSAIVTTDCGSFTVSTEVDVEVELGYVSDFNFENFDDEATAIFSFSNGTLTEVNNPAADALNGSTLCGKYDRDAGSEFDVIVYDVSSITNADEYIEGEKRLYMDVYTSTNVGAEILIQMETDAAEGGNYPTGRHSRWRAKTTRGGEWERLAFTLLDEPDGSANARGVTKLVVLFQPNRLTSTIFHYDNFDSYTLETTSTNGSEQLDFPLTTRPNPTDGMVQLDYTLPESGQLELSVYDAAGRRLLGKTVAAITGENTTQLNLGALKSGIYFVRLRLPGGERTVRVMKR